MKRCKTILVCGSSIDGKISAGKGISSKEFGKYLPKNLDLELHKLRSKVDGILVSINTVLTDNPSITVRKLTAKKCPTRILLDRRGRVPKESKILNEEAETIILTSLYGFKRLKKKIRDNIKIIICKEKNNEIDLHDAFRKLKGNKINVLLIEGGGTLNKSLFKENLVDKFIIFYFPIIVGGKNTSTVVDGVNSFYPDLIKMKLKNLRKIGNVIICTYENEK